MLENCPSQRITIVEAQSKISLIEFLQELWAYRGLVWALCTRECKSRYKQTILGPLWFLFYPLITATIFTIIFGFIVRMPSNGLPYLLFYLSAIILWSLFIFIFNQIIPIFLNNISLIKKVYFPRVLLVAAPILLASIDFFVGFLVLLITSIFFQCFHLFLLLYMPLLLTTVILFAASLGLFLAPLSTKYRDLTHFTPFALQCFYYISPILYPVSQVPEWCKFWFMLNPLCTVITSLREILMGQTPNLWHLFMTFFCCLIFFLFSCWYFVKAEKNIADLL